MCEAKGCAPRHRRAVGARGLQFRLSSIRSIAQRSAGSTGGRRHTCRRQEAGGRGGGNPNPNPNHKPNPNPNPSQVPFMMPVERGPSSKTLTYE